jgi:hypothetical protein
MAATPSPVGGSHPCIVAMGLRGALLTRIPLCQNLVAESKRVLSAHERTCRNPDFSVRGTTGRTPDFSVRGDDGPGVDLWLLAAGASVGARVGTGAGAGTGADEGAGASVGASDGAGGPSVHGVPKRR